MGSSVGWPGQLNRGVRDIISEQVDGPFHPAPVRYPLFNPAIPRPSISSTRPVDAMIVPDLGMGVGWRHRMCEYIVENLGVSSNLLLSERLIHSIGEGREQEKQGKVNAQIKVRSIVTRSGTIIN